MKTFVHIILSLLAAAPFAFLITELFSRKIYFSAFVGIPAGLVLGTLIFIILNSQKRWKILNAFAAIGKNIIIFILSGIFGSVFTLIFLMETLIRKTAPGEDFGLVIGVVIVFFLYLFLSFAGGGIIGVLGYNIIKYRNYAKLRRKNSG